MRLKREKIIEDKSAEDRQRILEYKTTFTTDMGKGVYMDLLNKFYFLRNQKPEGYSASEWSLVEKGQRMVIEHIIGSSNIDLAQFDKVLRGDFNG